jgi:predicted nucleotidyltransferase
MTNFNHLLRVLTEAGVEFLVIGGFAATAHGSSRLTEDVDILYCRSEENIGRLTTALAPLSPYLRDVPKGLPFRLDVATIARGLNFTLTTDCGPLDLFGEILGGGTYENLIGGSVELEIFGIPCRCLSLPQLIHIKKATGRPKDILALAELEALRETLDEAGSTPPPETE